MHTVLQRLPQPPADARPAPPWPADRPAELASIVRRTLDALDEADRARRVEVMLHDGRERPAIDPSRVCEALGRVLSNACRFSAPETTVRLSSRSDRAHDGSDHLVLVVSDRGIGMTPPQLQRAFDVFWRADPTVGGRRAGLGLGLSIARDLVEAQGGWISLRSEPGLGTEAELWLPRTQPSPQALAT